MTFLEDSQNIQGKDIEIQEIASAGTTREKVAKNVDRVFL